MDQHPEPMTSGDVAAVFGVTMTTVKRWAESGRLPHFKTVGGHYRFRREDVEALKASTTGLAEAADSRSAIGAA